MDSAGVDNSILNHSYLAYTRLWCDSSILPLSETLSERDHMKGPFHMRPLSQLCSEWLHSANKVWTASGGCHSTFRKTCMTEMIIRCCHIGPLQLSADTNIMPFYGRACSMWYFLFSCLFHFHYHEKLKHLQTPWTGFALSLGFYLFEGEKLRVFKVVTMHCRT